MTIPDDPEGRVRTQDRDRYLATLLAPEAARAGLFALHALDLELAQVVASTTEPLLGEIRLAWWREALDRLDSAPAPAQPTLAALAAHVLPAGVQGRALASLEDAFLALLLDTAFDAAALDRYAASRGGTVFAAAARLLGSDAAVAGTLGKLWALAALVRQPNPDAPAELVIAAAATFAAELPAHLPKSLRPLTALTRLAQADLARWAAGRALPPRGTAGRQLRMQWTLLTGR